VAVPQGVSDDLDDVQQNVANSRQNLEEILFHADTAKLASLSQRASSVARCM
jgi:hypothetical protein